MSTAEYYWSALDAGGTMTDSVIVNPNGGYLAGKALTNKQNESQSFLAAMRDAASLGGRRLEELLPHTWSIVYAGTVLLNTLLSRTGAKVGLMLTQGLEDYLLMEKGEGAWLGYGYADRLHTATHWHAEPLIPRNRVAGVQERVDMFGREFIPIRPEEVKRKAREMVERGAEVIAVVFLFAHLNPAHEQAAAAAIREVYPQLPVVLSHEIAPTHKEYARLASVVAQAYAGERSRIQFQRVQEAARSQGYTGEVSTLLAHGGIAPISYPRLYESYVSGPIGGLLGAHYVGDIMGESNIVCCDVGGTSFDVGVIRDGRLPISREPQLLSYRTNLPTVLTQSIGAGMGSELGLDPLTGKLTIGPRSAGSDVGRCYRYPEPTITDCHVVLGYVNPDYFLGGEVKLDRDKALLALEPFARHFGVSVETFAEGAVVLLHEYMQQHLNTMLRGRGYEPAEYTMFIYGGGGPLELHGIVERVQFREVISFPFAAVFSAFGVLCAPHRYRYHQSVVSACPPTDDPISRDIKASAVEAINGAWATLEARAREDFERHGWNFGKVRLIHYAYVRYTNQLSDFEVPWPQARLSSLDDLAGLMREFENVYTTIYPKQALYSELGYQILEVALVAEVDGPRPQLPKMALAGPKPSPNAEKGERAVYWRESHQAFRLYEMDELKPGNVVNGPAILEHPATTLLIPPGRCARFDERRLIHYQ